MGDGRLIYIQRCTNPRCKGTWVTKFCMVAPDTHGFCEWDFLHVSLLVLRILRCLLDFQGLRGFLHRPLCCLVLCISEVCIMSFIVHMKLPPFLILFFIKFLVLSQQSSFRDKVNRTVAHSLMFNGIEVVITTVFQAGTIAQNKCVGI